MSYVVPFIVLVRYFIYFVIPFAAIREYHFIPTVLAGFCVHLFALALLSFAEHDIEHDYPPFVRWFLATHDEHFTTLVMVPMTLFLSAYAYMTPWHMPPMPEGVGIAVCGILVTLMDIAGTLYLPGRSQPRSR